MGFRLWGPSRSQRISSRTWCRFHQSRRSKERRFWWRWRLGTYMCCVCVVTEPYEPWKKGLPWLGFWGIFRGWNLMLYGGLLKKTSLFWATSNFMESIWGFFFVAPMDVSVPTHDWVVVSAAQDAELLRASQRSKANGSTAICRNLPKNWPFQHKTSGSLNYHELPILGGGINTHNYRFMYFANFQRFPLLNLHCLGWCPMMTPFFWALGCQEYIRSGGSIAGLFLDRFPWIFFKKEHTNLEFCKHPFVKQVLKNWMTPNCYMKNVCFTISIHFKIVV